MQSVKRCRVGATLPEAGAVDGAATLSRDELTQLLDGIAGHPELMQGDGIHPRPEAQPKMLANFLPTLLEVLP